MYEHCFLSRAIWFLMDLVSSVNREASWAIMGLSSKFSQYDLENVEADARQPPA